MCAICSVMSYSTSVTYSATKVSYGLQCFVRALSSTSHKRWLIPYFASISNRVALIQIHRNLTERVRNQLVGARQTYVPMAQTTCRSCALGHRDAGRRTLLCLSGPAHATKTKDYWFRLINRQFCSLSYTYICYPLLRCEPVSPLVS